MQELPTFGHMTTSTRPHYFKRAGVAIFADIIKIITMFIKTIFKESRKVKRVRNYVPKCNLLSVFLYIAKFVDFR